MRLLTTLGISLCFAACSATNQTTAPGRAEQAVVTLAMPGYSGRPGKPDALGLSVATCGNGDWVAGGEGFVAWKTSSGAQSRATANRSASAACELTAPWFGDPNPDGGLYSFPQVRLHQGAVEGLAAPHQAARPLVFAVFDADLGVASFLAHDFASGTFVATGVSLAPGHHVSGMSSLPGGGGFVAVDTTSRELHVFKYAASALNHQALGPGDAGGDEQTGAAWSTTTGNFDPLTGLEVAVGNAAERRVYIYNLARAAGPIRTLVDDQSNPSAGFGTAVTVEPGDAGGGLNALWVSAPGTATLYRFVGSQAEAIDFNAAPGAELGASLATTDDGTSMLVGAPGTNAREGAVYQVPFTVAAANPLDGVATDCDVARPCPLPGCLLGTCVGGVLCVDAVQCPEASCVLAMCVTQDAGTPDGGPEDGGLDAGEPDAGPTDTGPIDAGTRDAGGDAGFVEDAGTDGSADGGTGSPFSFTTSGCSATGSAAPLLVLALLKMRRP